MTTKKENEKMWQNFEVKGVCREDLVDYIDKEKALKITDAQMEYIANKMGDALQETYWIALETILEDMSDWN